MRAMQYNNKQNIPPSLNVLLVKTKTVHLTFKFKNFPQGKTFNPKKKNEIKGFPYQRIFIQMANIRVKAKRTAMIFHFRFHSILFINTSFYTMNNDTSGMFTHVYVFHENNCPIT